MRRHRGPDGTPRYPLFEDTGICMPREKASRGLKTFVASMACEQAYRPAAAHVAVFSHEQVSPAAVEACAAPLAARAEDASLRRLNGEIDGTESTPTLFIWGRTACTATCTAHQDSEGHEDADAQAHTASYQASTTISIL